VLHWHPAVHRHAALLHHSTLHRHAALLHHSTLHGHAALLHHSTLHGHAALLHHSTLHGHALHRHAASGTLEFLCVELIRNIVARRAAPSRHIAPMHPVAHAVMHFRRRMAAAIAAHRTHPAAPRHAFVTLCG
jgi:hypothetical protein